MHCRPVGQGSSLKDYIDKLPTLPPKVGGEIEPKSGEFVGVLLTTPQFSYLNTFPSIMSTYRTVPLWRSCPQIRILSLFFAIWEADLFIRSDLKSHCKLQLGQSNCWYFPIGYISGIK